MKVEHETQKQKKTQDANVMKKDEDGATSRGSANGRPQGARERKSITEASAEKQQKVEKERDELREALETLEAHLGTGTRPYGSEDGTRSSRVKKTAMAKALRSVSRKRARSKELEIVDLDKEESVPERVARLTRIALQAGARGSSSPDGRKQPVRQSPRLSAKSDRSAGSDMRSGSPPKHKLKSLSFADALMSPTPEEKKARERVDARK